MAIIEYGRLNFRDAWYNYTQNEGKDYLIPVDLPNPDDNLNIAEPWHDFGNYKELGIDRLDVLFVIWKRKKVFNLSQKKAYSIKEEGSWWNHSENNDTPGRRAFDKEVEYESDVEQLFNEFNSFKKRYKTLRKEYEINYAENDVAAREAEIKMLEGVLEDLKTNHKRAYRKIENAEKNVANAILRLAHSKERLEKTKEYWEGK